MSAGGAGFDRSQRGWLPLATVGPQALVAFRPVAGLTLQAAAALDVALMRNAIAVGTSDLWASPPLSARLTLAVGWQFL